MVKRVLLSLLLVDAVLLIASLYKGEAWSINSQIAFWSSALVMGASMLSYARMVRSRIDMGAVDHDDRDTIDKMEDPYDLYSDSDSGDQEGDNMSPSEIKEAIKDEKKRLRAQKRTTMETIRDTRPFVSLYRIAAYTVLVLGFFYLKNTQQLNPLPYLIGLGLPAVAIVATIMNEKRLAG